MPWATQRAPEGWKTSHSTVSGTDETGYEALAENEEEVDIDARKRAWARVLAKVYEVDPLVVADVEFAGYTGGTEHRVDVPRRGFVGERGLYSAVHHTGIAFKIGPRRPLGDNPLPLEREGELQSDRIVGRATETAVGVRPGVRVRNTPDAGTGQTAVF